MCILIYNWTTDQSNQSWAALLQCNCCTTTNRRRRRRRRPKLSFSWSWRYFQAQVQGGRERRHAMDMNMQWGLISGLGLPWRMALSPAWCCLNMNFITIHLSWLVMGFCTVLPCSSHTFPVMMLAIVPFIITLSFCIDFWLFQVVFKQSIMLMSEVWLWEVEELKLDYSSHLLHSHVIEKIVGLNFWRHFWMWGLWLPVHSDVADF